VRALAAQALSRPEIPIDFAVLRRTWHRRGGSNDARSGQLQREPFLQVWRSQPPTARARRWRRYMYEADVKGGRPHRAREADDAADALQRAQGQSSADPVFVGLATPPSARTATASSSTTRSPNSSMPVEMANQRGGTSASARPGLGQPQEHAQDGSLGTVSRAATIRTIPRATPSRGCPACAAELPVPARVNVQAVPRTNSHVAAQMLADVHSDKAYDTRGFVKACRAINVTPHVAQNTKRSGGSAIDGRTTRHPGYESAAQEKAHPVLRLGQAHARSANGAGDWSRSTKTLTSRLQPQDLGANALSVRPMSGEKPK
jgi:hypothetical protein